jgi:hypothetical protein
MDRIRGNIERARKSRNEMDDMINAEVESLRLLGASWVVVGQALGISKQAAAKKYGHLDQAITALGLVPEEDRKSD